jgi:hypothetical protein
VRHGGPYLHLKDAIPPWRNDQRHHLHHFGLDAPHLDCGDHPHALLAERTAEPSDHSGERLARALVAARPLGHSARHAEQIPAAVSRGADLHPMKAPRFLLVQGHCVDTLQERWTEGDWRDPRHVPQNAQLGDRQEHDQQGVSQAPQPLLAQVQPSLPRQADPRQEYPVKLRPAQALARLQRAASLHDVESQHPIAPVLPSLGGVETREAIAELLHAMSLPGFQLRYV